MKKHQDMLREIILNILKLQQKQEKMSIKYLNLWREKSSVRLNQGKSIPHKRY